MDVCYWAGFVGGKAFGVLGVEYRGARWKGLSVVGWNGGFGGEWVGSGS